ncbi:MAG: hypothetical protein QXX09_01990 [Candidatus Methanomethylicia archaeon]
MSVDELNVYPLRKSIIGLQDSLKTPIKNILSLGHVPMLSRYMQRSRIKMGLPDIPPTAYSKKDAATQILEMAKILDFENRFGFDLNKRIFKY